MKVKENFMWKTPLDSLGRYTCKPLILASVMCAHGWCGASTETNAPRAVTARASVTKDERRR